MEKKNYHKITVADMAPHVHSFQSNENKVDKILSWLTNWIKFSLECGKIHPYYLLPSKVDLASHIGVSQGTIQNVFRLLEDAGLVESKQRIGTYIKDNKKNIIKFTSKREIAIEIVKKYILENSYHEGQQLPSIRELSRILGVSNTTLRMTMVALVSLGVLEKSGQNFIVLKNKYCVEKIQMKTLVEKTADAMRKYILENYKQGEKLPANTNLTKIFKVSVKTIHDAVKMLVKEGILYTRRGQYGTIVSRGVDLGSNNLYFYEKIEQKIIKYMIDNCEAGDKLPPIRELAKLHETSEKTIKKALDNLSEDGYLGFARGRYGGTFVLEVPQTSGEAYKWLAISNDYISN